MKQCNSLSYMVNTEESQLVVSAAIAVMHFVHVTSCY